VETVKQFEDLGNGCEDGIDNLNWSRSEIILPVNFSGEVNYC
jgi:hypothetical protein